jgi:hypothetical protein
MDASVSRIVVTTARGEQSVMELRLPSAVNLVSVRTVTPNVNCVRKISVGSWPSGFYTATEIARASAQSAL